MVPSKEMDHTFTEPQNTSDNENEFEIPPIMSTPLPPRKRCKTRGGFNQNYSNSFFHQPLTLISPIVNAQIYQSQLLLPSQSTLPASPSRSLSPPPATPPQSLSPLPATLLYDPLTQLPSVPSQYSGKANEFCWNDNGRGSREFNFFGSPGVKNISENPNCPLSILKTFLTDELIDDIVIFTNTYAEIMKQAPHIIEKLNNTQRSMFKLWMDVDSDDVWVYICIIILMGIIKKPYYHMYWTMDCIFVTPIFSRLMRRDRFEQIRSMIHFSDPRDNSSGSLRKLSSFLSSLQHSFRENYIPGEHITVDEYLSLWKGRLHFKQFIPSKRERYGVKIYMLCESSTGYLWKFIIYTGADTVYPLPGVALPKPFDEYGNPSKVVLSLLNGLYNKGYKVVLDNLYTSPELLRALVQNETDAFGTLRSKKGLPSDFWKWNPQKGLDIQPMTKFCDGILMVCRWNDCYKTKSKKVVSMMSTKHTGNLVNTGKIHYATKQHIIKPDVIVDYNATMGGVDNLSRVIDPYSCQRKSLKWYRKLAELFIDISVYNSYIVWKEINSSTETHLNFRQMIIKEIITWHSYGSSSNKCGPHVHDQPLRLGGKTFLYAK